MWEGLSGVDSARSLLFAARTLDESDFWCFFETLGLPEEESRGIFSPLLGSTSSLDSSVEGLAFRDLARWRLLKVLEKLLPSDGPPANGGKTPMGKDIFSQLKAYPSEYDIDVM